MDGKRYATPLFLVLLLVESADAVFALDSIPAIFAITTDPFIVFTSNVFAILGLRSLYFLLAGALDRFYLLKPALAAVLAFVGVKLLITDLYKIPISASLSVIAALLMGAVAGSIFWPKRELEAEPDTSSPELAGGVPDPPPFDASSSPRAAS